MQIKHTLTRNERDVEVTIELSYSPGCRGHCDRYGAPEEPDEPASFEVETVEDEHGNDYDLSDAEYDEVVEKAWERQQDRPERDFCEP
jgi:hypothetical protein